MSSGWLVVGVVLTSGSLFCEEGSEGGGEGGRRPKNLRGAGCGGGFSSFAVLLLLLLLLL